MSLYYLAREGHLYDSKQAQVLGIIPIVLKSIIDGNTSSV